MKTYIIVLENVSGNFYESLLNFISSQNDNQKQVIDIKNQHLNVNNLIIKNKEREVTLNGRVIELNRLEFDTLHYLYSYPNQVLSKEQIYEAVWTHEKDSDIHAVTCVIYQIRKKIGKNYIKTHIGVGYQFIKTE